MANSLWKKNPVNNIQKGKQHTCHLCKNKIQRLNSQVMYDGNYFHRSCLKKYQFIPTGYNTAAPSRLRLGGIFFVSAFTKFPLSTNLCIIGELIGHISSQLLLTLYCLFYSQRHSYRLPSLNLRSIPICTCSGYLQATSYVSCFNRVSLHQ